MKQPIFKGRFLANLHLMSQPKQLNSQKIDHSTIVRLCSNSFKLLGNHFVLESMFPKDALPYRMNTHYVIDWIRFESDRPSIWMILADFYFIHNSEKKYWDHNKTNKVNSYFNDKNTQLVLEFIAFLLFRFTISSTHAPIQTEWRAERVDSMKRRSLWFDAAVGAQSDPAGSHGVQGRRIDAVLSLLDALGQRVFRVAGHQRHRFLHDDGAGIDVGLCHTTIDGHRRYQNQTIDWLSFLISATPFQDVVCSILKYSLWS